MSLPVHVNVSNMALLSGLLRILQGDEVAIPGFQAEVGRAPERLQQLALEYAALDKQVSALAGETADFINWAAGEYGNLDSSLAGSISDAAFFDGIEGVSAALYSHLGSDASD